jgi:hypothetical protein
VLSRPPGDEGWHKLGFSDSFEDEEDVATGFVARDGTPGFLRWKDGEDDEAFSLIREDAEMIGRLLTGC